MSPQHLSIVPDPAEASPGPELGSRVGPYVLERVLGEGTMGRVYQARHEKLGRPVAIKWLHASLVRNRAVVERFLQEARLVNQIDHPHIVEVHDFIDAPGQVYAVMELLLGQTLAARMQARALSLLELVEVATHMGQALEAAHALGVVHRDLKPENIFLQRVAGQPDQVKVLDFGVAKLLAAQPDRVFETRQGQLMGTPRYMSPEQVAALDVDARADVYAYGTVLYELLAGRAPFESMVHGQLAADILTSPVPPLPPRSAGGEPIPPRLVALVMACLEKDRDRRPASMTEVLASLTAVLDAAPGPAPSPRRSRLPVALGGALALAAAVGAALALWSGGPAPADLPAPAPSTRPPAAQPLAAPSSAALAPAATAPASPAEAPATPVPAAEAPAPPRAQVTLSLRSTPPGAEVRHGVTEETLGLTPLQLSLPRGEASVPLVFELKGYQKQSRAVRLDGDQDVDVTLLKAPRPAAKKPRPVTDGVIDPF